MRRTARRTPASNLLRLRTMLALAVLAGIGAGPRPGLGGSAEPRRVVIVPRPETSALRLEVGTPRVLSARGELDDGRMVSLDGQVTWSSTNPSVVRVTHAGDARGGVQLTPVRPGVASISITYPPISGAPHPLRSWRTTGDAITVVVEAR